MQFRQILIDFLKIQHELPCLKCEYQYLGYCIKVANFPICYETIYPMLKAQQLRWVRPITHYFSNVARFSKLQDIWTIQYLHLILNDLFY